MASQIINFKLIESAVNSKTTQKVVVEFDYNEDEHKIKQRRKKMVGLINCRNQV